VQTQEPVGKISQERLILLRKSTVVMNHVNEKMRGFSKYIFLFCRLITPWYGKYNIAHSKVPHLLVDFSGYCQLHIRQPKIMPQQYQYQKRFGFLDCQAPNKPSPKKTRTDRTTDAAFPL
jgi:hypothetical protein